MASEQESVQARKTQKEISWISYIKKLVDPETKTKLDYYYGKDMLQQMNAIVNIIARGIAEQAGSLTRDNNKKTISSREIQTAMRLLLPGELAKHAVSAGTKAVTRYTSAWKKGTRTERARLIFPVPRAERAIRVYGTSSEISRVGAGAPVYLAGVLQYIATDIVMSAGRYATDDSKRTITVPHLYKAFKNDVYLDELMDVFNIELMGGGVLPDIHVELLPTIEEKKKHAAQRRKAKKERGEQADDGETSDVGSGRSHKFLPGTVALRNIRKYQGTNDLLLQKAPFIRLVRDISSDYKTDVRYNKDTLIAIQHYIEQKIVRMYETANNLAIFAGRTTVDYKDIQFAVRMKDEAIMEIVGNRRQILRAKIHGISRGGFERLSQRGGVKRKTVETYDEMKGYMKFVMHKVIKGAITMMEHQRKRTVSVDHVRTALDVQGVSFTVV